MATGFVVGREAGFATAVQFIDPATAVSSQLSAAHFRFGLPALGEDFRPGTTFVAPLLLANTGNVTTSAKVSIDYTVGEQNERLALDPVQLNSGEVKTVELSKCIAAGGGCARGRQRS